MHGSDGFSKWDFIGSKFSAEDFNAVDGNSFICYIIFSLIFLPYHAKYLS